MVLRALLVSLFAFACAAGAQAATKARPARLPLVHVLTTGDTIAGKGDSPTDLTEYRPSVLPGKELLATVPSVLALTKTSEVGEIRRMFAEY